MTLFIKRKLIVGDHNSNLLAVNYAVIPSVFMNGYYHIARVSAILIVPGKRLEI